MEGGDTCQALEHTVWKQMQFYSAFSLFAFFEYPGPRTLRKTFLFLQDTASSYSPSILPPLPRTGSRGAWCRVAEQSSNGAGRESGASSSVSWEHCNMATWVTCPLTDIAGSGLDVWLGFLP